MKIIMNITLIDHTFVVTPFILALPTMAEIVIVYSVIPP